MLKQFDSRTDHRLLYRRLGISANNVQFSGDVYQLDLFTDFDVLERESRLQSSMLEVRNRHGACSVFKGTNLLESSTALERSRQIGGHRA